MFTRCAATALFSLSLLAQAQPDASRQTDAERKAARVVRTQVPPVLDGVLDEREWRGAGFVDDLEQVQPVEHAEPSERTEVYLLYDDEALYVGARLYDSEPRLITANLLRQNSWIVPDDAFYVTLDPFNTGRAGYFFGTNPNGVRYDGTYRNVSEIYDNWDGIFDAAAGYFDGGWVAEFRIPFKTLSFDPNTDRWGLNFSRTVARKNERIAWSSRNRSWDPSVSGLAVGFDGIQQGAGLDVVPSATYRRRRTFSPGASESDVEPSLDVFYKLTPSLNASVTINTDFSATEVDDAYKRWYMSRDPIGEAFSATQAATHVVLQKVRPADIESTVFRRRFFDEAGIVERVSIVQRGADAWRGISIARHASNGYCSDDELRSLVGLACLVLPMLPLNRAPRERPRLTANQLEARFAARYPNLTAREREVCARAALGVSVEATARELRIAKSSVLTYRQRAYQRLGVRKPSELAVLVAE